ncbi:MAG: hypothetical protein EXR99_15625 [Gemmataceae bacterium]|nr:hypothetical protein [Gemmataceae bacterium]
MAFHRRIRDHGAAAAQNLQEDLMPLILLFAVAISGLMLTVSYTWMKGSGYEFLAIFHALAVILTLLWLPFGKLFHIFQRPLQAGVVFYRELNQTTQQASCLRCQQPFAGKIHVNDLKEVEQQLGYQFELTEGSGHYQEVCPACRRKLLALAQGKVWRQTHPEATHDR